MKFSRLGENDIRCIISESELVDYGLELDDIIERRGRTREFFRQILDMAARELKMPRRDGLHLASAQISLLKDNSLSIVFHEASIDEVLMHLTGDNSEKAKKLKLDIEEAIRQHPKKLSKAIRNEIVDAMEERFRAEGNLSPSVESELRQIRNEIKNDPETAGDNDQKYREGLICFPTLDAAIAFCGVTACKEEIESELYKSEKKSEYYLRIRRGDLDLTAFSRLLFAASEYGSLLNLPDAGKVFLLSQCDRIIEEQAYQKLREVTA